MNMKRLLTLVAFFATLHASAQQVNPVPDYVFRNQMSVGRNAVTDTAAYFSIGPRYGATKGFMPPIVGDTATFSSGKRNGLLIFSVQKNKFLYWDSVRVQWSDMAGGSGSYILAGDTSAMLAPYLRKVDTTSMLSPYYRSATATAALALKVNISDTATMLGNYIRHAGYGLTKSGQSFLVDTLNISTRAWRQKGIDSVAGLSRIGGSGTTNFIPKFTGATTLASSQIFDNGTNVYIGTGSPLTKFHVASTSSGSIVTFQGDAASLRYLQFNSIDVGAFTGAAWNRNVNSGSGYHSWSTAGTERLRLLANGRLFLGSSPVDNGYQLDVQGNLRTTTGANFATSSGTIAIATESPYTAYKLHVVGSMKLLNGKLVIGNPIDSTRAISISGGATESSIWLEQYGADPLDLFMVRGNGTVTSKTNIDTGDIIGVIDFRGYLNGQVKQSSAIFAKAIEKDTVTNNVTSNIIFRQYEAGNLNENMKILGLGGHVEVRGSILTGAPTGGSAKQWKIGEAATVSPTSPNRTIRVEIDGVVYYIHAKTTND